jgi:hypothetical protein
MEGPTARSEALNWQTRTSVDFSRKHASSDKRGAPSVQASVTKLAKAPLRDIEIHAFGAVGGGVTLT